MFPKTPICRWNTEIDFEFVQEPVPEVLHWQILLDRTISGIHGSRAGGLQCIPPGLCPRILRLSPFSQSGRRGHLPHLPLHAPLYRVYRSFSTVLFKVPCFRRCACHRSDVCRFGLFEDGLPAVDEFEGGRGDGQMGRGTAEEVRPRPQILLVHESYQEASHAES